MSLTVSSVSDPEMNPVHGNNGIYTQESMHVTVSSVSDPEIQYMAIMNPVHGNNGIYTQESMHVTNCQ